MSFVGSLVGGILGAHAAGSASDALQQGAKQAQGTIQKGEDASQNFLNDEWTGTKQNFNPYLDTGSTAAHNLQGLLGTGFKAPDPNDVASTPGYQFNLSQGVDAINKSAAARGNLFSGTTGTALMGFGQGLAQNTYQQNYSNALQGYYANLQGLMGGAQLGEGAASTLGGLGAHAADSNTNINMGGAEQIAAQQNSAAQAKAGGILGKANAWSNAIGGMTGSVQGGLGNMSGDSSGWENVGNFALGALAV